jgi:hypothetical protein
MITRFYSIVKIHGFFKFYFLVYLILHLQLGFVRKLYPENKSSNGTFPVGRYWAPFVKKSEHYKGLFQLVQIKIIVLTVFTVICQQLAINICNWVYLKFINEHWASHR